MAASYLRTAFAAILAVGLLSGFAWPTVPALAAESETGPFEDEPAAHSLYDQMIETMRKAESLSYVIRYKQQLRGKAMGDCTFRVWLKKPNYFRVELQSDNPLETGGMTLSDGATAWVHWPKGRRPRYWHEPETDQETPLGLYMKFPASPHVPPIWLCMASLHGSRGIPILDPSIFHRDPSTWIGPTYKAEPKLDGFKSMGTEKVGTETCDKIGVSFKRNHHTWYLWLSQRDHLPRKLKHIARVFYHKVTDEEWSSVTLNADIPETMFAWKPPDGWKEWKLPMGEERLLEPGTKAPDFELASADGTRIRLSDFRGRVVWFYSWSAGCPPCRKGMPHLQEFHELLKDKGLVILGFNCLDDKKMALDLMHEYGVTFPNVLDDSDAAVEVYLQDYRAAGAPLNCIIGRDGKIVDIWFGYREQDPRPMAALMKTGGELEEAVRQLRDAWFTQSAKEVTAAAERLFQAIRAADYDHDWTGAGDSKPFLAADVTYYVERSWPGWVRWVCEKFKANPITEVRLGEVFLNSDGQHTVHFELRLKDGEVLQGDLPFTWISDKGEWRGRRGLDWHLQKTR